MHPVCARRFTMASSYLCVEVQLRVRWRRLIEFIFTVMLVLNLNPNGIHKMQIDCSYREGFRNTRRTIAYLKGIELRPSVLPPRILGELAEIRSISRGLLRENREFPRENPSNPSLKQHNISFQKKKGNRFGCPHPYL
ncbi:hypothetical protein VNO77_03087 [Canavalia gladiata]|uniref:Uncharacterized protein n=1 Tax=Canavalia gladiata TaxID=3824 RepID=A0AAN9N0K8_CANGL